MRMTVIGTGYLGAVHAACMADLGHEVLGVDTNRDRIEMLANGLAPFYEPGLDELLDRGVRNGSLRFTTSMAEAAEFADVHFVCVGTPQQDGADGADLRGLHSVIDELAPLLRRDALIIGKSTVPVGTATDLANRAAGLAPADVRVELAWNPEFLREGLAVEDTLYPNRIVVGVTSGAADATIRAIYRPLLSRGTPYISTDLHTAELVKVSANAFLATKLSFINAVSDMCEAAGADVVTLSEALGYDERIGSAYLSAGLGFGGSCLGKDVRAFIARARELGIEDSLSFLREVDEFNLRRRQRTAEMARDLVGGSFAGRNVAVLGAAFKPDTDDIRDSPALAVARAAQREGARVRVHDPKAMDNARAAYPELDFSPSAEKACEDADVVLHLTEWREYSDIDPEILGSLVRERRLIDARNKLPLDRWQAAGWSVRALGRKAS